jgi:hypothetical protein
MNEEMIRSYNMENKAFLTLPQVGMFPAQVDEEREISLLVNAIDYFLESVFIMCYKGEYRLIVMHNGRVLVDESYHTARGSKIAFYRFCRNRVWKEGVKPRWSPFFNPDIEAIDETCQRVKKIPYH